MLSLSGTNVRLGKPGPALQHRKGGYNMKVERSSVLIPLKML